MDEYLHNCRPEFTVEQRSSPYFEQWHNCCSDELLFFFIEKIAKMAAAIFLVFFIEQIAQLSAVIFLILFMEQTAKKSRDQFSYL